MGLLDDILGKPLMRQASKPCKKIDWYNDPDEQAKRLWQSMPTQPLGDVTTCPGCRSKPVKLELSADGSCEVCASCGFTMGKGRALNVELESRIFADDADSASKKRNEGRDDRVMIDLRERLPNLYDMVHKLTEQQKWQRLRLEQTQICMIGLADNVGLHLTPDERASVENRLVAGFHHMKKEEVPGVEEKGSAVLWAITLAREVLARREDGFTCASQLNADLWGTRALHSYMKKLASSTQYLNNNRDGVRSKGSNVELAARIVNSDLSSARKTRVDALGDDEAILRKIACLDRILRKAGEHNGLHPFILDNEDPDVVIPIAATSYRAVKRKRMEEKQDKKLQANVEKFFAKRVDAGGFYFNARQHVGGCICNNKGTCGLCLFVDEPEADVEVDFDENAKFSKVKG